MQSLLMQSLPNSGSTWLAELIAKHTDWKDYRCEFFNPLRSPKYFDPLASFFGCELVQCYPHIASDGGDNIDNVIRETWGMEGATFTKEVFSPCKLEAFTRHFKCFVLLRSEEDTFPPSRLRVWSFYEHAWWSLIGAGLLRRNPEAERGWTFEHRARAAHRRLSEILRVDAVRLGVPIIEYRDLFDDEKLRAVILAAIGAAPPALLKAIASTRVLPER